MSEESNEPQGETYALVVDAFHPVEGRHTYASFGPFDLDELDEAEASLHGFLEEVQERGPLLWEDRRPAVDPGVNRTKLEPKIPTSAKDKA